MESAENILIIGTVFFFIAMCVGVFGVIIRAGLTVDEERIKLR